MPQHADPPVDLERRIEERSGALAVARFITVDEHPTWPGKRVTRRTIGGRVRTPSTFVVCSLLDVRDGFARDCPHRHPVLPMLALRDRSRAAPSFFCGCRAISTVAGAAPRRRDTSGARWRRYAGDRLAGRFPWSGWGARESLPGHPSHGRRIGPRHGPILSPSPSVVAPARVASRGHPVRASRDTPCPASTTLASWRQLFWQVQVRPGPVSRVW